MDRHPLSVPAPRGFGRRRLRSRLAAQGVLLVAATMGGLALASPAASGKVLFTFADPRIDESSGLVANGRLVVTTNDSGDSARVFVVDPGTGRTVGVTTYADEDPVDVEGLATGPDDNLWIGDIGDNAAVRDHLTVFRIPMPGPGDQVVAATAYDLAYPTGPRDAETLLVDPDTGRLYVVSKGLLGGTVFAAPTRLRAEGLNQLSEVARAPGLTTDGAFLPDGRHVILRDYSTAVVLDRRFRQLARFELPEQKQGEGLAVLGSDRLLVSSEGARSAVQSVAVPDRITRILGGADAPTVSPVPRVSSVTDVDEPAQNALAPYMWPLAAAVLVGGLFFLARRRQRRSTT